MNRPLFMSEPLGNENALRFRGSSVTLPVLTCRDNM